MRRLWTGVLVIPLAVPSYVGGFVLIGALGPRGMLQRLLEPLGVERLPEIYGFPGAWLALTLFTYPYVFLVVRAALQGMDRTLEEASRSLGQSAWTTFWKVTLPQLRPAIAAGGLLVALYTLSDFGAVSLMQFDSFTRVIYVLYQGSFDRHLAAGLALVLVLLTLLVLVMEHWSRGHTSSQSGARANRKPLRRVSLGVWRGPATLYCVSLAFLAIVLPAFTVCYWLYRSVTNVTDFSALPSLAWNSLWVSAVAGLAAVLLAVPVAYLTVRFPRRPIRLFEYAIYLGYGLPGIVIALSLVFFGSNVAPIIYQTFFLLIAAYLIRFLPQAYGNVRTSLLQVNPSLEEASRSLGRSWHGTVRAVTLPLVRGGATAGGILVFVTTLKELPITLLLGPIGFKTLATEVWSKTEEGFFAEAAPVILVLMGISLVPTLLFAGREP
jgi:iron(III) transport system permease protein